MEKLTIIKAGGNIIDDPEALDKLVRDFAALPGKKILVHGGGKLATDLGTRLGIKTTLVDGRRITDAETLRVVTMVYAGWINKTIVAKLQSADCHAIGLCGADGGLITAEKRTGSVIDYGFAGDCSADKINTANFKRLFDMGFVPVLAPVTHDGKGQLLNTNADTIAAVLAAALASAYSVSLVYCFEKNGVLADPENDASVIETIEAAAFSHLIENGRVSKGMIPKLENAFLAKRSGARQVIITHARNLAALDQSVKTEILD
ncbi:MAG: acetylglutamate kinase [Bacteroidetes bacterium]|nr:MAG: acetylglutamate kinase [Bacteroidota bacterium]